MIAYFEIRFMYFPWSGSYGPYLVSISPSARPSAPQGNQYKISHFLASFGAFNMILHIHVQCFP